MAKVILICGLPGSGKSTLAEELAKTLGLPLFSKDKLEASIVEHGALRTELLNGIGYTLLKNLVDEHLERQSSVIVDFIADKNRVNELWPDLLTKELIAIECICSDKAEHKRRIESRKRNIKGWYELSWVDVVEISTKYTPLISSRLILDTIQSKSVLLEETLSYVSN
ncbi:AAA family ATPase [Reinekea marina]|uniref:AAA family ATPase n=1 Tax=Reinekea marina TaxID=1310421 RepID=A0ABV7WV27_9GAMM|nr:AAA family ATPase [Reinekea marina]MDN3649586.1 AAA family ATPase [Reinekea marina]